MVRREGRSCFTRAEGVAAREAESREGPVSAETGDAGEGGVGEGAAISEVEILEMRAAAEAGEERGGERGD